MVGSIAFCEWDIFFPGILTGMLLRRVPFSWSMQGLNYSSAGMTLTDVYEIPRNEKPLKLLWYHIPVALAVGKWRWETQTFKVILVDQ